MLEPAVEELFSAANFAHLATALPDGSPHTVPVWAGVHDGRIAFFTQPASRKARNLAHDPRAAISVVDRDNPYRSAWVRGRVDRTLEGDAALEVIDAISHRYTRAPFPMRSGVVFLIAPERQRVLELPFEDTPAAG